MQAHGDAEAVYLELYSRISSWLQGVRPFERYIRRGVTSRIQPTVPNIMPVLSEFILLQDEYNRVVDMFPQERDEEPRFSCEVTFIFAQRLYSDLSRYAQTLIQSDAHSANALADDDESHQNELDQRIADLQTDYYDNAGTSALSLVGAKENKIMNFLDRVNRVTSKSGFPQVDEEYLSPIDYNPLVLPTTEQPYVNQWSEALFKNRLYRKSYSSEGRKLNRDLQRRTFSHLREKCDDREDCNDAVNELASIVGFEFAEDSADDDLERLSGATHVMNFRDESSGTETKEDDGEEEEGEEEEDDGEEEEDDV